MKTSVGYPDAEATMRILSDAKVRDRARRLQPVVTAGVIGDMAALADEVYVDPALLAYVTLIAEASRRHPSLKLGLSVRGCLAYVRCAKTWAASQGRTYVVPDDIKMLAVPVLSHRLLLDAEAQFSGTTVIQVIEQILGDVPPPVQGSGQAPGSAPGAGMPAAAGVPATAGIRRQPKRPDPEELLGRRRATTRRPSAPCTGPRTPPSWTPHASTRIPRPRFDRGSLTVRHDHHRHSLGPDAPATRRARREAARRQVGWSGRVRQTGRALAERTRPGLAPGRVRRALGVPAGLGDPRAGRAVLVRRRPVRLGRAARRRGRERRPRARVPRP